MRCFDVALFCLACCYVGLCLVYCDFPVGLFCLDDVYLLFVFDYFTYVVFCWLVCLVLFGFVVGCDYCCACCFVIAVVVCFVYLFCLFNRLFMRGC